MIFFELVKAIISKYKGNLLICPKHYVIFADNISVMADEKINPLNIKLPGKKEILIPGIELASVGDMRIPQLAIFRSKKGNAFGIYGFKSRNSKMDIC